MLNWRTLSLKPLPILVYQMCVLTESSNSIHLEIYVSAICLYSYYGCYDFKNGHPDDFLNYTFILPENAVTVASSLTAT